MSKIKFTKELQFIELPISNKQSCENDLINNHDYYVCQIFGKLYLGRFYRVWFGWVFNGWTPNPVGFQLDHIERVWVMVK